MGILRNSVSVVTAISLMGGVGLFTLSGRLSRENDEANQDPQMKILSSDHEHGRVNLALVDGNPQTPLPVPVKITVGDQIVDAVLEFSGEHEASASASHFAKTHSLSMNMEGSYQNVRFLSSEEVEAAASNQLAKIDAFSDSPGNLHVVDFGGMNFSADPDNEADRLVEIQRLESPGMTGERVAAELRENWKDALTAAENGMLFTQPAPLKWVAKNDPQVAENMAVVGFGMATIGLAGFIGLKNSRS